ncbi:hypothetical protein MTO96_027597 [Rhipicephalus appendiculatus]
MVQTAGRGLATAGPCGGSRAPGAQACARDHSSVSQPRAVALARRAIANKGPLYFPHYCCAVSELRLLGSAMLCVAFHSHTPSPLLLEAMSSVRAAVLEPCGQTWSQSGTRVGCSGTGASMSDCGVYVFLENGR